MKKRKRKENYSKFVKNKIDNKLIRIHKETSIEKKIRLLLQSCKIPFIQEFKLKNKYFDFLIFDYINEDIQIPVCIIEVNGDYFHAREYIIEQKKPYTKLTKIQKRNVQNDKKKKFIAQEYKFPIIHIWETDIKKDMKCVKKQLMSFLKEVYGKIPSLNKSEIDFQ